MFEARVKTLMKIDENRKDGGKHKERSNMFSPTTPERTRKVCPTVRSQTGSAEAAWNTFEGCLNDGCESPRTEEKEHCLDTRGGLR